MASLKSIIPQLAKSVGMTPAAIYERQRALVRAGLLHVRPGRGPGSGVPADAKSVATLLISILVAGSLSEVVEQTKAISSLKSLGGLCSVTGKRTFGAALTAALQSNDLRSRTLGAYVRRSGDVARADILFTKVPIDEIDLTKSRSVSDHSDRTSFGVDPQKFYSARTRFSVEASLFVRSVLREIEMEA